MDLFGKYKKAVKPRYSELDSRPVSRTMKLTMKDVNADVAARVAAMMSAEARRSGQETLEESEDFDVPDERGSIYDFPSPWEEAYDLAQAQADLAEQKRHSTWWKRMKDKFAPPSDSPPRGEGRKEAQGGKGDEIPPKTADNGGKAQAAQ